MPQGMQDNACLAFTAVIITTNIFFKTFFFFLTKCRFVRFVLPRWKFVRETKEKKVEIMYVAYIWQCRIDPPAFL